MAMFSLVQLRWGQVSSGSDMVVDVDVLDPVLCKSRSTTVKQCNVDTGGVVGPILERMGCPLADLDSHHGANDDGDGGDDESAGFFAVVGGVACEGLCRRLALQSCDAFNESEYASATPPPSASSPLGSMALTLPSHADICQLT